ncbi:MAG: hypothetical protein H5U39_03600, partial [Deferribacterales bacterium]|nr:hypothetical protein [Deferribacterales bacterium]
MKNSEKKIVEYLIKKEKPVKLNELIRDIDIDIKELKKALKSLIKAGEVTKLRSNKYCITE